MSSTKIYAVKQNGDVVSFKSVHNAWGGAMHVWNSLNEEYGLNDSMFTGYKKTWKELGTGVYEAFEDIVLGSTFDMVWVKKENIDKLIKAFGKYCDKYDGSNLQKQIEILNDIKNDGQYIGVSWCQTSVADDLWDFYDDEEDELMPYNINKGKKHWELFEELGDDY